MRSRISITGDESNPALQITGECDQELVDDLLALNRIGVVGTVRRAEKLRVEVFPEASRKLEKPLKYASARGARIMAIFGENEMARGEASIRNLETREQQAVPRDQAAAHIGRMLNP